jgi:hypothetical protein
MKPKTAEQLHTALDGRLDGYLRTDEASRALWSADASIYLRKPVGVVVARSLCRRYAMLHLFEQKTLSRRVL